jgi:hypothetical protein
MPKLLLSIFFSVILAAVMLQLRQEYLHLNFETSRLHEQIEDHQAKLWSQQLQIAEATAPNAIAAKIKQDNIEVTPAATYGSAR